MKKINFKTKLSFFLLLVVILGSSNASATSYQVDITVDWLSIVDNGYYKEWGDEDYLLRTYKAHVSGALDSAGQWEKDGTGFWDSDTPENTIFKTTLSDQLQVSYSSVPDESGADICIKLVENDAAWDIDIFSYHCFELYSGTQIQYLTHSSGNTARIIITAS